MIRMFAMLRAMDAFETRDVAASETPETPDTCGILDAVEPGETPGSNGGCDRRADWTCEACGLPVCGWHAWLEDAKPSRMLCAVCRGIEGHERSPVHAAH